MADLSRVNLNRLAVFVAVVEAGSLTAAADRLGIAKTMVSTHMQRLEAEVRASLLVRTTRQVRITEAGRAFYEASRQILRAADLAVSAAAQDAPELQGTLRVAAPIDYGATVIAPVLVALRARHPALKVELVSNDRRVDLLAEDIDVAIRLGRLADSSHRAALVGEFNRWLVAAPAFVAAWGRPIKLATLAELPFVALSVLPQPLSFTFEGPRGKKQLVRFNGAFMANTAHACRAATLAGGGIAILSDFSTREDVAAGRLVRLLPGWAAASGAIHALFPSARYPAPKVRIFIDALKAHLGTAL